MLPLHAVEIENFRAIRQARIELDPRVTVFFGGNAAGKTSVLDALAIALGAIPARIPRAVGRQFAKTGDIRVPWCDVPEWHERAGIEKPYSRVTAEAGQGLSWDVTKHRSRQDQKKAPTPIGTKALAEWLDPIVEEILETANGGRTRPLPVVAAYGTERSLVDVPLRERGFLKELHRFGGLDQALLAQTRFRTVFEWFRLMEDEERRQQARERNFDFRLPALEWVRRAVAKAELRCHHPRVETQPIRMLVDFEHADGTFEPLDISSLSDGYRTHFSLVVDLARRMAQLNPSADLEDPERGTNSRAVVLIDEIDLHLHPEWQGRVVQGLLAAFPQTQFVLTTHSEQVIASVAKESVRKLVEEGGEIQIESVPFAQGATGERVSIDLMGAPQRVPGFNTKKLDRYLELVHQNQGHSAEALALRAELEPELPNDAALHQADLEMQRRDILKRLAEGR